METERKEMEMEHKLSLKHLGFVRAVAINVLVFLSNLYEYAKQNSGPLKPAVGTVEGAVTAVVGPVFDRLKGVPDDLLVFFDDKVELATCKFDAHAPPLAKRVTCQVHYLIKAAIYKAQELVHLAQSGGPGAAANYAASEAKQFLLHQTVKAWGKLDHVPPFHTMAELALPTAAHWSDKYNRVVIDMSHKGYVVFGYLPLVRVDDIAKAFKQASEKKDRGEVTAPPRGEEKVVAN